LRGERSRFQLFGDTVNTAARLESSGEGNKIHISELTATLIKQAGQGDWIQEREDLVHLKGKGTMKTYWLSTKTESRKQNATSTAKINHPCTADRKTQSLVQWNVGKNSVILFQVSNYKNPSFAHIPNQTCYPQTPLSSY
jgi:hypothetical protein